MSELHTGVYGDHSTDGWLEWGLQERFASQRAEREAQGDFGANFQIRDAVSLVKRAETTDDLRRAEILFNNAGILAAKEALFHGVKVKGWHGETSGLELPPFERVEGGKAHWFMNHSLHRLESLPDRYQILANLADNPLLKDIRQTGSRLIPANREIRFAKERVEAARRNLDKEEAELAGLQQE